jgi:imidazoleglycerol phosphate dehydratase HisB
MPALTPRVARDARRTRETTVDLTLTLDGNGVVRASTGIGFLDHLLHALAFHAGFDLECTVQGDLVVDDHHTVEDTALALGRALDAALGDRRGIRRFGSAHAPLDEALARAVVDCSGRPFARIALDLRRDAIGAMSCENVTHFFASFATAAKITLHLDMLQGDNDHHRAEAAAKALALALRDAVQVRMGDRVPSTKGTLT